MWERDLEREEARYESIGLSDYTFMNRTFRSNCLGKCEIPELSGNVVEMLPTAEWNIFDYGVTMERANAIHTVASSIIFLLEQLDIKRLVHIYTRYPDEKTHQSYSYLLKSHKYFFK